MCELGDVIRATERDRLRSLVEVDMAVAQSLHAEDFRLITPRGVALSKQDYLEMISSGRVDYHRFEPVSDIEVLLDDRVVALRYRSWIENSGEGQSFSAQCWHTDCYRLTDGRWQAVWSHATEIPDE
jgi:hypothetical protein